MKVKGGNIVKSFRIVLIYNDKKRKVTNDQKQKKVEFQRIIPS